MKTILNLRLAHLATQVSAAAQHARPVLLGAVALLGVALALPARAAQGTAASSGEPVQVTQPDAESLRVRIYNATGKPALLRVVHLDNGQTILSETHREAAYGTRLKFDTLPCGRYAVTMRVGDNKYRYEVQVDRSKGAHAATIAVRETSTYRVESGLASAAL
jgi:hypothetical protein